MNTEDAIQRDLERIIDAAPDATILVDFNGCIVRINAQTERLFGFSRAELLGQKIEILIPIRFRSAHISHREKFEHKPAVREMGASLELYGRKKNGGEFPIDVNLSPVELSGRRLIAAAVRDFTQHQKIQDALRAATAEAQSANTIKSRFLAAASHDLRQPLQSLSLYLSVLQRQSDDPTIQEISTKMRGSLNVMGELLNALLDLSKLERGAVTADIKAFPIQELLDKVSAHNAPMAELKELALIVPACDVIVRSDPYLLQRIIDNFIGNAIRYTTAGHVRIECKEHHGRLCIAVSDTGIGIPAKDLDTIFEEYMQLDNPVRDRSKGMGLGLSITRHIARLLKHNLHVESIVGKGSVFSVEVPLGHDVKTGEAVADSTPDANSSRHLRVLIIDDDPSILDATAMLLQAEGHQVRTGSSLDEALETIDGGFIPTLLISDYRLPGVNGLELITRLRQILGADLPAVLMTGDTTAVESAQADNCLILYKPVDTGTLLNMLNQLISG